MKRLSPRELAQALTGVMNTNPSRILSPAVLLYTLVVVTQFAYGAYLGARFQFPEGITLIYAAGTLWGMGWWLLTDRRRQRVLEVYDLGFFLYLAWPAVMAYYLIKTRGARGLLVILGFVAAYAGAAIVGAIFGVVVVAVRS